MNAPSVERTRFENGIRQKYPAGTAFCVEYKGGVKIFRWEESNSPNLITSRLYLVDDGHRASWVQEDLTVGGDVTVGPALLTLGQ